MSEKNKLSDVFYKFSKTRRFKLLIFGILTFALLCFVFSLREIFIPVLIGGLIAYILEPLVKLVCKTGLSRLASILIIYASMLILTTLIVVAISIGLTRQVRQIANSIEEDMLDKNGILVVDHNSNKKYDIGYRKKLKNKLSAGVEKWNVEYFPSFKINEELIQDVIMDNFKVDQTVSEENKKEFDFIRYVIKKIEDMGGELIAVVFNLIMIPIYAFLLQRLAPQISQKVPELIPEVFRDRTLSIFSKINLELSAFFRGKLFVCFTKGLMTWIGLSIVGVNYAFFIGFLAGALSIIPYLGAVIGFLFAFLLTVLDKGSGPLVSITVVFVVMEIVEFGLHIMVFGKEVGVHPLAFILALFIGGSLFGVFGVIMAVPLLSVASILWKEFVVPLIADLALPGKAAEPEELTKV